MKHAKVFVLAAGLLLTAVALSPALAVDDPDGLAAPGVTRQQAEDLFKARCATCHNGTVERAPDHEELSKRSPESLVQVMTTGAMRPMATGLSANQIRGIAVYLTGRQPVAESSAPEVFTCSTADPIRTNGPMWNGWGVDEANTRFQPRPGLTAADVPKLKVKWTFAYPGMKNGQATIVGDRIFISSNAGRVYSLNAKTGCVYWRFDAPGGVRTSPVFARNTAAPSGNVVYIGDDRMTVHALDAMTGKPVWSTKIEDHVRAVQTGTPVLHDNLLYVPTSSLEETVARDNGYACCTFRGSVVAIDVRTGKVAWQTYTIESEAKPFREAGGMARLGPAGGAIWSSPTIDAKRGVLYAATGDSYTDVSTKMTDAIVAMDLRTGAIKWVNQVTENDNFLAGCIGRPLPPNCPTTVGPDYDFGSSVIIRRLPNGKDVILAGQKSGIVFAMDPDNQGKILWQKQVGTGGVLGGIQFGMAADVDAIYVAVSDQIPTKPPAKPGLTALRIADGEQLWHVPAPAATCSQPGRCSPGQSAPVTAIPGVVFSGALNGRLRAYDAKTGAIIWEHNTAGDAYDTVNGVKGARGGALDGTGPTIAGGMMFQHSGYSGYAGGANGQTVLIAYTVDGK